MFVLRTRELNLYYVCINTVAAFCLQATDLYIIWIEIEQI